MPFRNCWRTAPTACSEASNVSKVGALEHGVIISLNRTVITFYLFNRPIDICIYIYR